jgi:hypothetical protein
MPDCFGEVVLKFLAAERTLFFLEVADHVLNNFCRILIYYSDHHPAEDGINMCV